MNFKPIIATIIALFFFNSAYAQNTEFVVITADNVDVLQQVTFYGDGTFSTVPLWSPDGLYVAIGGSRGVWIFPTNDFENHTLLEFSDSVDSLTWSPDSRTLHIIIDSVRTVISAVDWEELETSEQEAEHFTISPDGRYTATSNFIQWGNPGYGTIPAFSVYDTVTREHIEITDLEFDTDYSLGYTIFTPDSKYLITIVNCYMYQYCSVSSFFSIWELSDGTATLIQEEIAGYNVVALDNETVAFNVDGVITTMEIATGETETLPIANAGLFRFSNNRFYIMTREQPPRLVVFDRQSNTILWDETLTEYRIFDISPDGNFLVQRNESELQLFDISNDVLMSVSGYTLQLNLPDELNITEDDLSSSGYNCPTLTLADGFEVRCGAYSPDGNFYLSDIWRPGSERAVYLVEVASLSEQFIAQPGDYNDFVTNFVFNADTTQFAFNVSDCDMGSRCYGSTLYLWDMHTDEPKSVVYDLPYINDLIFAPTLDQNLLLVVHSHSIRFVDTRTGQGISWLSIDGAEISQVLFSDDGTQLFVSGRDNTVSAWEINS